MRSTTGGEPVSVLDRLLAILDAVRAARGPATVTDIALATGIPKSTASRMIADLVARGYLARDESGVRIGIRFFSLGARAVTPRRLESAARPVLAELFHLTGEHLNVAVCDGDHMLSVVSVRGRLTPAPSRAGVRVPSATTALGKAVLAFTADVVVLDETLASLPTVRRRSFERELCDVRVDAVAVDRCATFPGVLAVASPVLSPERLPLAAISVAGPDADMDVDRVAPLVRHAALALTHRLAAQVA